jgi:hypothetical protein
MVSRVDLRVHTTASSSRKDDERFKAQAEAYGSFVAGSTFKTVPHDGSLAIKDVSPSSRQSKIIPTKMIPETRNTPEQQIGELTEVVYDPTTFLEETQLGYTALESQLFAPSSRISAKGFKQIIHPPEDSTTEVSKPESEPSGHDESRHYGSSSSHQVPSQSSYLESPVLDRSNKKPRINEENRHFFRSSKSLLPSSSPLREHSSHALEGDENVADDRERPFERQHNVPNPADGSVSVDDVTSELPTSYSLSDMTSVSSKGGKHSIQRSVSDPGLWPSEATGCLRQEHVPHETTELASSHDLHSPEGAAPVSTASTGPVSPSISNSNTVVKDFANVEPVPAEATGNRPESQSYAELPTSIRPPAPQPSLQRFETHVTESLGYLGDNTNLAQCYKPVFVSRDLRQSERGCWIFDMTSWPAQLRTDFFQFLAKMVESGRVGWGVWCVRELAELEVRVFCWGEIVRHVYLMLYVASKSKVRKLGLKWIDADGEVIVQMRGPDNDSRNQPT